MNFKKRKWKRDKHEYLMREYYEKEFTKQQLQQGRELLRQAKDKVRDKADASGRKLCEEKYTFYYSETGDKVAVRDIPINADELQELPDHKTKKSRFYKQTKPKYDKKLVNQLDKYYQSQKQQLKQLENQMNIIDLRLKGPFYQCKQCGHLSGRPACDKCMIQVQDTSLTAEMDGLQEIIKMLKQYR